MYKSLHTYLCHFNVQMKMQIEELIVERDNARSQVQDLLRVVEDNENSLVRVKSIAENI